MRGEHPREETMFNHAAHGRNAARSYRGRGVHPHRRGAVNGIEPKEHVRGPLQHGFLEDALPLLEVPDGMLDDPDIAYNHGVCLGELGRVADSIPYGSA